MKSRVDIRLVRGRADDDEAGAVKPRTIGN